MIVDEAGIRYINGYDVASLLYNNASIVQWIP